jgi:hypothetical protein
MTDKKALKDEAHKFLESLERELANKMPSPKEMRQSIHDIVTRAKNNNKMKHMRQPEDAFLYHNAVPIIFRHMQTVRGIGESEAKQSLLSEFYRNMPDLCLDTPARLQLHPFDKVVGTKPAEIVAQWTGKHGAPLKQACPDFSFREPFPFKIVFEGKYFQKGGLDFAQKELAVNIYQAFFYRALPYVAPKKPAPKKPSSPAWDYDFACLLAYDASDAGNLKQAWEGLTPRVRRGFWEGADVYVMILRGEPGPQGT